MTISLTKTTDTCTNCGAACAASPSIEVDPLCTGCIADFRARDINLPLPGLHDLAMTLVDDDFTITFSMTLPLCHTNTCTNLPTAGTDYCGECLQEFVRRGY